MTEKEVATDGDAGVVKRLLGLAFEGVVQNLAWALLVVVAVATAAFLDGSVPAWTLVVAVVLATATGGFIAAATERRAARMRGERDEARRHEAEAVARLVTVEDEAEQAKRELREQLAAASRGQAAVSTRMQSVARQIQALRQATARQVSPTAAQVELLVAIAEDFRQKVGDDLVVSRLINRWTESGDAQGGNSWGAALDVLEARAISIGTEEALRGPDTPSARTGPHRT